MVFRVICAHCGATIGGFADKHNEQSKLTENFGCRAVSGQGYCQKCKRMLFKIQRD